MVALGLQVETKQLCLLLFLNEDIKYINEHK